MTLDGLPPRILRMVALIVANRAAIAEPNKGLLLLHFKGGHVAAKLYAEPMALHDRGPPAAGEVPGIDRRP